MSYGWSHESRVFHLVDTGAKGWSMTEHGERWIAVTSAEKPDRLVECEQCFPVVTLPEPCKVDGCENDMSYPGSARGMCGKHYMRAWRAQEKLRAST